MKKNNKNAMSIILAIILTVIMSLIALYMIDYIIPFSKNVKGIENVSKAYYQAEKGIEESLFYIKNNFGTNSGKIFISTNPIDNKINIVARGNILPPIGQGNSDLDGNFNKIRVGKPIQLRIGNGMLSLTDWDDIVFKFNIPNIDNNNTTTEKLKGDNDKFIINWKLIAENETLNASGSQITYKDINDGFSKKMFDGTEENSLNKEYFKGFLLDDTPNDFKSFYASYCNNVTKNCILKMTILNKLEVIDINGGDPIPLPYLEWKIDLSSTGKNIPLRYTQIHTEGKSFGFKKTLDAKLPQQTVNEAFDFTVFQ